MKKIITTIIFGLLSSYGLASSTTTTEKSTATLASSCIISSNDMTFGSIIPQLSGNIFSTGSVNTLCTKGTAWTVGFGVSTSGHANISATWNIGGWTRQIKNTGSANYLQYNIFQDSNHTKVFGNASTFGNMGLGYNVMATGTGTGANQLISVYAAMGANQFVVPGNYSDTIPVTVSF